VKSSSQKEEQGEASKTSAESAKPNIEPPSTPRAHIGAVRGTVSILALVLGFALLLVSFAQGNGPLTDLRTDIGNFFLRVIPSLGEGASTQVSYLATFALAVGLLVAGTLVIARNVFGAVTSVEPTIKTTARSSSMIESLGSDVSVTMIRAGVMGRPLVMVRRFAVYSMISALVVVPTSILATYLFAEPLFLLLNVIPIFILFYPTLLTRSKVGDTVRGVDEELPYFSVMAAILQSAGLTLYDALTKVGKAKIFKWIEYEGKLIARESLFFGKTQTGAIVERGAQHPSEKFRTYLQGYTSIMASGGDAATYLEEKAKDLIYWNEFRWRSYGQSASDLGEAIIAIFFTLPLIVIAGAFVSPGDTLALVVATIVVIIPVMAVVEYSAIVRMQPKNHDVVRGWTFPGIGAAVLSFAVGYYLTLPPWLDAGVGLIAFSLVYGWSTFWQLREIRKCEDALPQFMRDVTEYKKIGYDITKAIRRLAEERSYNRKFDGVLEDVSTQLKLGSSMKEVIVKTRSWLTQMVFYLLGEVVETGGGTPALLENVTDFTQRIVGVRKETKSNMRVYGYLAYATPIGLTLVIFTMYYMVQQFGGALGGQSIGFLGGAVSLPPSFLDLTKVLVVEAAVVVGFLAGKAIDFTDRSTFRIATGVTLALASIIAAQILIPALGILSTT
jgi:flagellar protein FlaJ